MRYLAFLFTCFSLSAVAQQDALFYYLKVVSTNCDVQVFVNGFPVYNIHSEGTISNQVPINLSLIGRGNKLTVQASALGDSARVAGNVSGYGQGSIVSTDDNLEGLAPFDIEVGESTEKVVTFDNVKFNFTNTLVDNPVIKDQQGMRQYAVDFLVMLKSKETQKLLKELEPKIRDTAVAFSAGVSDVEDGMRQVLESSLFNLPIPLLAKNQINVNSYCDGRIWELTNADGDPLIHIKQYGGTFSMRIFVGMVDGNIRIVR